MHEMSWSSPRTRGIPRRSKEDYFKERLEGALVVPGAPEQCTLLLLITGQAKTIRAIEAHRLPDDAEDLFRGWIAAGADSRS